jgi:CheY-like chemotaxis protein
VVLVVEDIAFYRRHLRDVCRELGARALEAGDGVGAQETARIERVDIVLLDLGLPRLGGLELLRALRAGDTPVRRDAAVLLVTSQAEERVVAAAMRLDADGFLRKPVAKAALVDRLAKLPRRLALGEVRLASAADYRDVELPDVETPPAAEDGAPPGGAAPGRPRGVVLAPAPPRDRAGDRAADASRIRELPLSRLRSGLVLARPVTGPGGHVLVPAGTTLDPQTVLRLHELNGELLMRIGPIAVRD